VKGDVGLQVEGVGQAAWRDLPAFGQARREFARFRVLVGQSVVDAGQRDAQLRRGVDVGVDARRRQRQPIDQPGRLADRGFRRFGRGGLGGLAFLVAASNQQQALADGERYEMQ
jgi:hypothetical protein